MPLLIKLTSEFSAAARSKLSCIQELYKPYQGSFRPDFGSHLVSDATAVISRLHMSC